MHQIVGQWYWAIFLMLAWVAACGSLGAKIVYDDEETKAVE